MFKAKLIEDTSFYQLRRKQLILFTLPSIPLGILFNYLIETPHWPLILLLILYFLTILLLINNQKALTALTEKRMIEIDEEQIRIQSKYKNGKIIIPLKEVDKIILKEAYGLPQETMNDLSKEIKGQPLRNFIVIKKDAKQQRFDFIIDSYYMLKQLEKLTAKWSAKGYPIDRIQDLNDTTKTSGLVT